MCYKKSLISLLIKFPQPHLVGLPNGQNIPIVYAGDAKIHENIVLHNVLYVLEFRYNLVSIPMITSQINIWIVFTDKFFSMIDIQGKWSINLLMGKQVGNLYINNSQDNNSKAFYIASYNNVSRCNSIRKENVLNRHKRFGHL